VNAKLANDIKDKVRKLQVKLYLSAKESKKRRYHALYDKIYREDILQRAWKDVKKNSGSAGIDKETIQQVEEIGVEKVLGEISEQLKEGKYQPLPVKRVEIPKDNGKKRPLGIPVVRDRIVQAAVKIVIEPIFEADFKESSHGFRPKRNAHQAIEKIRKVCNNKGIWVIDADIEGYFNNINHDKLMILIQQRISDRRILKIISKWLKAGIMQDGKFVESKLGSPQGGVISPLLSNIYLNYLDTVWEKHYSKIGKLIRFADDFVVVCKNYKDAQHAYKGIQMIMSKLELTLSKEKTKIVSMWQGKQGFLTF
jgi:group II intron reverse transcriptase/maturase